MKPSVKTIYVDADACPVKSEIVEICEFVTLPMVFVSSYSHTLTLPSTAKVVTVDNEKEAVDLYLMNNIKKGDICVTQDHALASILLAKGVIALSPRGFVYREETILQMLDARYVSQKHRRMGGKTKGPKPFRQEDRSRFIEQLTKIVTEKEGT
ncbi:YaiI/YqxD family protein [Alkalihalobacillus sp. MEB130]|uniref:YaiI/YqxD family protein n=1 Tax=Alkalihalobacillus sp. MEB130 TaxID=2976704 RepID=UPI0028DE7A6A|nr:YaiI/YqxD family protein [Alkalihalobacillus sp. MEB130]MDT8861773.1 YaiI/YqxD family protein [Alkalihalobacillus sp. MEB130]